MQTLELVLILIVAGYIGFNRLIQKKLNKHYVIGLLFIILSLQLLFNGYRYQMIPAYLLWVTALITAFIQPRGKSSIMVRVSKASGFFVLLVLSIALPTLLPVFELPQPTGPYSVGTRDIHLKLDREEVITADTTDQRSLMIKVWYPSKETNGKEDAYVNKSTSVFYEGVVLQSGHSNFMDIPFMIPLKALSQAGDIDPDLAIEITGRVVTSFFDKHLKNKEIDMKALSGEYDMLEMNIFKGDSIIFNDK